MKLVFSSVKCCFYIISVCFLIQFSEAASLPDNSSSETSCDEENSMSANPVDCSTFYKCVRGSAILTRCPKDFEFNEQWKLCTWPEQANCTRGVTDNSNGDQSSNVTDTGQPFTMIFDKYFPDLKKWEARISNTTLLNIAGEPQSQAVIEADVIIFRKDTAINRHKIQIHNAERLENSTAVAAMLERYTVSCAILNLKYRMVADFPEPPPWCLPHLVNKVASTTNLQRAYHFLNRVSEYYH
nr:putative salivary protein [Nilaparvata lugens]